MINKPDQISRREVILKLASLPFVSTNLSGILDPEKKRKTGELIPVMLTPFRSDKSIDWPTFERLTEFYAAAGAYGYFANCASSEMYLLKADERLSVTKKVIDQFKGKKPVVSTGSFGDTIKEKAEFSKKINDLGTDAVILITSHFAEKNESDEILIQNIRNFLDHAGDIRLGTYECPSPYKRILSEKVISFMVNSKRFVYHKDTSEDMSNIHMKLQAAKGSKLQLYNAHTASAVASIQSGASGLSPISANFYPEILHWVCQHANTPGQQENAQWIQSELAATEPLISDSYPLSAKYFLKKRGLPFELVTRVPRRALSQSQQATLDKVHNRFLGWCERLDIKPVKV